MKVPIKSKIMRLGAMLASFAVASSATTALADNTAVDITVSGMAVKATNEAATYDNVSWDVGTAKIKIPSSANLASGHVRVQTIALSVFTSSTASHTLPTKIVLTSKDGSQYESSAGDDSGGTSFSNGSETATKTVYTFSGDCILQVGQEYNVRLLDSNGDVASGISCRVAKNYDSVFCNLSYGSSDKYTPLAELTGMLLYTGTVASDGSVSFSPTLSSPAGADIWFETAESATLTDISGMTYGNVYFNTADGQVLTLSSGVSASTINIVGSGCIDFNGKALSGTLGGTGVIVAEGSTKIDALATSYSTALKNSDWKGTVWLKDRTGWTNFDPTAYGNANSTLRFSGIQGHFAQKQCLLADTPVIELENDSYSYGLNLNNGYSYNEQGGWSYVHTSELKGSGTLLCNSGGGALLIVGSKWSDFTGVLNLTDKTVWFGITAAPTATNDEYVMGTVSGGIRIADGKTVAVPTTWTVKGVTGAGTVQLADPTQVSSYSTFATRTQWTGTVELAAHSATSADTAVYLEYMGNSGSTVVLKGLSNGGKKHHLAPGGQNATKTIDTTVQLDGDVTIDNGYSGCTYTIKALKGSYNFSNTFSQNIVFQDVSAYTGTLSCNQSSYPIKVGVPSTPTVGDLIVKVNSANNKVSTSVLVNGSEDGTVRAELTTINDVYGLYATAAATVNDTAYTSVAAAVAAAGEGDTVTLSRTGYNEQISITKDLTIALNNNALNCDSFSVADGVTLTINGNKQIKAPAFTGGGSIVSTTSLRLCPTDATATSSLASIDVAGALSFDSGSTGTFNVSGDVTATGTITVRDMTLNVTGTIEGSELNLAASDVLGRTSTNGSWTDRTQTLVNAVTINAPVYGSGKVNASNIALGGEQFVGNLTATKLMKSTSGSVSLFGVNTISEFEITQGTVTLGNPYTLATIAYDFDAQNSPVAPADGYITSIADANGGSVNLAPVTADSFTVSQEESIFGGRKVFKDTSDTVNCRLRTDTKATVGKMTTFMVWKPGASLATWSTPMNDSNSSGGSSWGVGIRKNLVYQFRHGTTYNGEALVYVNGVSGGASVNTEHVMTACGCWSRGNYLDFGIAADGDAIAEVMVYQDDFTLDERAAIEAALMAKWGIGSATYTPITPTAVVTLANFSTLDLGGLAQTVKSVTGSGTVQNGTLTVTEAIDLEAGDVLTLPNTDTFTLGTVAAEIVSGDGTTVTLYGSLADAIIAQNTDSSGTLTITATATGVDLGTTVVSISDVLLAKGVSAPTFANNAPFSASYSGGAISNTRLASTYVWTPGGIDTNWATLGNWRIGEATPVALPGESDKVTFPATAEGVVNTVTLDSDKSICVFTVNGDTRITGGAIIVLSTMTNDSDSDSVKYEADNAINGSGILYFGPNGGIKTCQAERKSQTVTVSVPKIVIEGTADTPSCFMGHWGTSSKTATTQIKASDDTYFEGSGVVKIGGRRTDWSLKTAKWTGFTGKTIMYNDAQNRDTIKFTDTGDAIKSLEGSSWEVYSSDNSNFTPYGQTYTFGELTGTPRWQNAANYTSATLNIGCLNTSFSLGGVWNPGFSKSGNFIHKQGTGTMTFTGTGVEGWFFENGTVLFTDDNSVAAVNYTFTGGTLKLPSVETFTVDISDKIVSSTSPISIEIDSDRTWDTALAASNTGGLVKKGSGTLTLSAAPAASSFTITVVEGGGSVVIPANTSNVVAGENTVWKDGTTLVYGATVDVTIPSVPNTTLTVMNGEDEITGDNGVYTIPVGVGITVTYTPNTGYELSGTKTYTINSHASYEETRTPTVTDVRTYTWVATTSGGEWSDSANWDYGAVPTSRNAVVFPAGTYSVYLSDNVACGSMEVNGVVTVAQTGNSAETTKEISVNGNVTTSNSGTAKVILGRGGIRNASGSGITFAPKLESALTTKSNGEWVDSWIAGSVVTFNNEVIVNGRLVTWDSRHVFNGNITIKGNGNLAAWGVKGFTFNDITVAAENGTSYIYLGDAAVEGGACIIDGTGFTIVGAAQIDAANGGTNISAPSTLAVGASMSVSKGGTIVTPTSASNAYKVNIDDSGSLRVYSLVVKPMVEPDQTDGETYATAEAAEAAAADVVVSIPSAVAAALTDAQETAYVALFEAKAVETSEGSGEWTVVVDFTDAAKAALQDDVDDALEAIDFDAVSPSVTVDAVPGLYYAVKVGTTAGSLSAGSYTMATSTSITLDFPMPDDVNTVKYYTVVVSSTTP